MEQKIMKTKNNSLWPNKESTPCLLQSCTGYQGNMKGLYIYLSAIQ